MVLVRRDGREQKQFMHRDNGVSVSPPEVLEDWVEGGTKVSIPVTRSLRHSPDGQKGSNTEVSGAHRVQESQSRWGCCDFLFRS